MKYQDYLLQLNEKKDDEIVSAIKSGKLDALEIKVESIKNNIHKKIGNLRIDISNIKAKQGFKKDIQKLIEDGNTEEEAWKVLEQKAKENLEILIKANENIDAKNTKLDAQIINVRANISKIKNKELGKKDVDKLIEDGNTEEEAWDIVLTKYINQLKEYIVAKNSLIDDVMVVQKTGDISSVSHEGLVMSHNYLNAISYLWRHPTKPRAITLTGGVRLTLGKPESKLNYLVTNPAFENSDSKIIKDTVEKIKETELKIAATIELMFTKKGLKYYTEDEVETFKTVKTIAKEDEKGSFDLLDDILNSIDVKAKETKEEPEVEKETPKKEKKEKKEEPKEKKIDVSKMSNDDLADLFS